MTEETTPRLALPLLHASQAQKEWTHNEALILLDAVAGGAPLHGPATEPPADAEPGSLWRVASPATGEWAGQEERLAIASPNGWRFVPVRAGAVFPRASDGAPVRRTQVGWSEGELAADSLRLSGREVGGGNAAAVDDPATVLSWTRKRAPPSSLCSPFCAPKDWLPTDCGLMATVSGNCPLAEQPAPD